MTTTPRTKPLIRWAGGKSRLLKHLLPLPDHTAYVEAFAGGLALLLAKERSKLEIVNDLNGDLINLYRCVQWHPDALITELSWVLNSRRTQADFLAQPGLTDLQRASRWLVRNKLAWGGNMETYGLSRTGGGGVTSSRDAFLASILAVSKRLDRVSVENVSWERMLSLYDAPGTLFFLDPPYLDSNASSYSGWTAEQMIEFARHVRQLAGQWIVTVDDSALNRSLFAGCSISPVTTVNGSVNQAHSKGKATFGELIIRKPAAKTRRSRLIQAATLVP